MVGIGGISTDTLLEVGTMSKAWTRCLVSSMVYLSSPVEVVVLDDDAVVAVSIDEVDCMPCSLPLLLVLQFGARVFLLVSFLFILD